jgi:hypothetical protein
LRKTERVRDGACSARPKSWRAAVNPLLRDRVVRHLDTMPDERAYQILDYIEFLESKYALRPTLGNTFQRFAEGVEDTLRAGRLPATAVAETMTFLNKAAGVLNGVAAAGKSMASDIVQAATKPQDSAGASAGASAPPAPPASPPGPPPALQPPPPRGDTQPGAQPGAQP